MARKYMHADEGPAQAGVLSSRHRYDAEYFGSHCGPIPYDRREPHWLEFFGKIADEIIARLKPRRVLDVGCAKGFLVECLRDRGVEAYGFDLSEYAIGEVRPDIRRYCWIADITEPIREKYDLITCIEVLEHVSEGDAHHAIQHMTARTDAILFSSSPVDFDEPTHINVKPIFDWLKLFSEVSFGPDIEFQASFVVEQAMLVRRLSTPLPDEVLRLFAEARTQAVQIRERNNELTSLRANKKNLEQQLFTKEKLLSAQQEQLNVLQQELEARKRELAASSATLDAIFGSKGWKLLKGYRELRRHVRRFLGLR